MIIVTGGAGFIGSNLVKALNERGEKEIIIVDEIGTSTKWKNLVDLQFKDYIAAHEFFEQFDTAHDVKAIFHLGAISATTEEDFDLLWSKNVEFTKILAQFAIDKKTRFIYASSAATYGDGANGYDDDLASLDTLRPLNRYGFSKHLVDLWMRDHNYFDQVVGLKFFNVYGPREQHKGDMRSMVSKSLEHIQATGKISLFKSYRKEYADGEQKRDFVFVGDCLKIMLHLLDSPSVNGLFNVGSGKARSWNDLARAAFGAIGKKEAISYVEMPESLMSHYQYFTEANIAKLRAAGFTEPMTTLEDGVRNSF